MNVPAAIEAFSHLIIYHRVVDSAPAQAMHTFLKAVAGGYHAVTPYLHLVRSLYEANHLQSANKPPADAWQNHLIYRILTDENPVTMGLTRQAISAETTAAITHDLSLLQRLFGLTGPVCRALTGSDHLPTWPGAAGASQTAAAPHAAAASWQAMAAVLMGAARWPSLSADLLNFHRTAGTGLMSRYWYLTWDGHALQGIEVPQAQPMHTLIGLAEPKETITRNTRQFLSGSANNLLLYGARGTGKSTLVRSLPLQYGEAGLRLIEVSRSALGTMPTLFRRLRPYPQRFILFLDDLSFGDDDSDFKAFKSLIEGALEQRPDNVLLYATSNRRHLVPERWTDRHTPDTAEVHGQDAMEEKLSLSDRFGVTVLFPSPSQAEYLAIVRSMAAVRRLNIEPAELEQAALRWVVWNNPRSGRAARQFIEDLAGRLPAPAHRLNNSDA